jgi:hypothetical protein
VKPEAIAAEMAQLVREHVERKLAPIEEKLAATADAARVAQLTAKLESTDGLLFDAIRRLEELEAELARLKAPRRVA